MKQIKRCLALVLALMLALGAMGALAATKAVKINKANFPDAEFRKYVKAEFDTDKDGVLSAKEIKAVTSIDVAGVSIASMKGIELFTRLTDLKCYNNKKLKQLDVSGNKRLKVLWCFNDRLTTLTLGTQKYLDELLCMDNPKLKTLDLAGCPKLKKIVRNDLWSANRHFANYGWGNKLSTFDIKITLKDGRKVLRKYAKPTKVSFTKKTVTLEKGAFSMLPAGQRVKMTPSNVVYPYTVTSDNPEVFACDDFFDEWDALSGGTANVTVRCGGRKGTMKVTVK